MLKKLVGQLRTPRKTHNNKDNPNPNPNTNEDNAASASTAPKRAIVSAEIASAGSVQVSWELKRAHECDADRVEVLDDGSVIHSHNVGDEITGTVEFDVSGVENGKTLTVQFVDGENDQQIAHCEITTNNTAESSTTNNNTPKGSLSFEWSADKSQIIAKWSFDSSNGLSSSDYIALFKDGESDSDYITYEYADGEKQGEVQISASGSVESGTNYQLRYISADSSSAIASSDSFEGQVVESTEPSEPTKPNPGTISFEWSADKTQIIAKWSFDSSDGLSSSDYIALFKDGESDSDYLTYEYADGAQEGSATIEVSSYVSSGTSYNVRYIFAADSSAIATSSSSSFEAGAAAADGGSGEEGESSVVKALNPQPDGTLTATFDVQKQQVVCSWDFPKGKYELSPYDTMYFYDAFPKYGNYAVMTEQIGSGQTKDSKSFVNKGQLEEGKAYYIRYAPYKDHEATIMYSRPFKLQGMRVRGDRDVCTITTSIAKPEEADSNSTEVTITWEMREEVAGLSQGDMLVLVRTDDLNANTGKYDDLPYREDRTWGFASGDQDGEVVIHVDGIAKSGTSYTILYTNNGSPTIILGRSEPITFDLSHVTSANETTAKEASSKFNMTSTMQHMLNAAKRKMRVKLNPLLTIKPEQSKYEKMLSELESRKAKRKAAVEADVAAQQQQVQEAAQAIVASAPQATAAPATPQPAAAAANDMLDEENLLGEVSADFDINGGFIYAGAGVSMSAPSSSPSWWALMNETLKATFEGAPPEHASLGKQLGSGDVTRQPEEIMESFYFVFQDRLFSLFQLLEAGRPNSNHIGMAKLAKAGRVRAILTTNFDIFIERALKDEGVPFRVIVTNDEFREFYENGCSEFAVLKIHGTVDRPDTIVAVANHYKMGKGFGGYKATVLSHYLRNYPTLFVGYSGWDFEHANYQAFWAQAGEEGGRNVYWLTLKGMRGGPDLKKILGTHIGKRLRVGASMLPDFLATVVRRWYPDSADEIMAFHQSIDVDKENKAIVVKRQEFLKDWVAKLPKVPLLTLLLMEAGRLNAKMQDRTKRIKEQRAEDKSTEAAVGDTNAMTAFYTKLATDMASGLITMDQYMEQIQLATLEQTFQHVPLPKAKKDELKKVYLNVTKTNPVFTTEQGADMFKNMCVSYLMAIAQRIPDAPVEQMMDEVVAYINEKVKVHDESTERGKLLRETYMYLTMYPQVNPEDRDPVDDAIQKFVDTAIKEKWDDSTRSTKRTKDLFSVVQNLAYGSVDTNAIVKSQVQILLDLHKAGKREDFLEGALLVALGLQRQAMYRTSELSSTSSYSDKIVMPLATNPHAEIDASVFMVAENEMNKPVQPILDLVAKEATKESSAKNAKLTAKEVVAAFEVASAELWVESTKYLGNAYTEQLSKEREGYYPHDSVPKSVAAFLVPRVESASVVLRDDRLQQSMFSLLVRLGDGSGNIDVIEKATHASLELTQGKVTELTPYPIPEALAVAYEEKALANNRDEALLRKSLEFFVKSLDGIKTCVMRQKTDAIVLQACLVQGEFDKEKALKMGFTYSPHFSSVQQLVMVGPCRGLLVQQMAKWATELGYPSLTAAEDALTKKE